MSKSQLMEEDQQCHGQKRVIKDKIRDWSEQFKKRTGKDPTAEDKKEIKQLYVQFQRLEEVHSQVKSRLLSLQEAAAVPIPSQPQQEQVPPQLTAAQSISRPSEPSQLQPSAASIFDSKELFHRSLEVST